MGLDIYAKVKKGRILILPFLLPKKASIDNKID